MAAIGIAVLAIPIVAELVIEHIYALAAAIPALIGAVILSDRLCTFFVNLKAAAPTPRLRALEARRIWGHRWLSWLRSLRGAEWYPANYLIFVVPVFLVMRHVAERYDTEGAPRRIVEMFIIVTVAALLWPLALELLFAPIYGRRPYGPRRLVVAFWRALLEWCNYNRLNTQGVGIHGSPCGSCSCRRQLLIGVIFLWACIWSSTPSNSSAFSQYMFDMMLLNATVSAFSKMPEIMAKDQEEEEQAKWEASNPPFDLSEQQLVEGMTPARAEVYLRERQRLYGEAWTKQKQQEQQQAATQKSASLVILLARRVIEIGGSVMASTLGTALACLSLVFAASARALAGAEDIFGRLPRQRILSSDNWEMLVDRLRASRDECERNSLFLGTNSRDDTPVLVPREVFTEHAHILGDSGSGKTSLGLMPLICQLMRDGKCSVVVIDLKADDQALFETLRHESAALDTRLREENSPQGGYPFRWFTTALERSSYIFNPLMQRVMPRLAAYQRSDIITAALGLQYGTDYGRKFFGDANYDLLSYAVGENPNIQSFEELAEILKGAERFKLESETKKAATNLRSSIRRLARCRPFNASPNSGASPSAVAQAIDFSDVFRQPQALYFALPPASGVTNTAEIARMAIYSLLAAAQMQEGPRQQVFLVIDEFQRIVANNLGLFLQTARSMNIGVILSNQSLDDLETVDANLIPAVRTNTRFRQVFAAGNRRDILDLRDTAGETMIGLRSWDLLPSLFYEGSVRSMTVRETPVSRLMLNDILLATDAFGRNIASVRRGAGYAQFGGMPFVMDSVHHIPWKTFNDRRETPWPPPTDATIVASRDDDNVTPQGPVGGHILEERPSPVIDDPSSLRSGDDELASDAGPASRIGANPLDLLYEEQRAQMEAQRRRRKREDEESPDKPAI